jgi:arsenate reductase-like glutaredoxin family protein
MTDKQPYELTLIYNSDKTEDKQAKTYIESLPGYHIETFDLAEQTLTADQLATLIRKLEFNIEDLLDPAYDDHISVHKEGLKMMSRSELLTVMISDLKLINTPILVSGGRVYKYESGNDLKNLAKPIKAAVL